MPFDVRPKSEMPLRQRGTALSLTLDALRDDESVFVPTREGETPAHLQQVLCATARRMDCYTRMDNAAGGLWIYKREPRS